jgi:hypothetical protein
MGKHSASKEVVMAVQEAIERVESSVEEEEEGSPSLPSQLITLVELYASCESLIVLLNISHNIMQLFLVLRFVARRPLKLSVLSFQSYNQQSYWLVQVALAMKVEVSLPLYQSLLRVFRAGWILLSMPPTPRSLLGRLALYPPRLSIMVL